ncbi:MAG: LuxR family transcriptional regulator [Flavobacterium sp.]|nr:MAG: LuxR family transcriptional regulator [Flavobacterium sp.]
MSPEIEAVLGYHPDEATFSFLLEKIHPDDTPYLLNFEAALGEFIAQMPSEKRHRYKYQYDFRIQRADGKYVRILNQLVIITYEIELNLIRTFGVQCDITHLKTDPKPRLSFIGFEGEPSYYDVVPKTIFQPTPGIFSPRERQILELIVEGKTSKKIAEDLFISKFTVDTHRKQMLRKANCKSASELISKAILEAWI